MRRVLRFLAVVALLGSGMAAAGEQEVRPIVPRAQQEVVPMGPRGEQVVRGMGGPAEQQVERFVEPTAGQKAASNASKAVTGVAAAAVSLGAMAAMLLLL